MKKRLLIATIAGLALSSHAQWATSGGVSVYTDKAEWEAAIAGQWTVQTLETTAANVALADEVSATPGNDTQLGSTLTFDMSVTGFNASFALEATQESGFVYNDYTSGSWTDALGVGYGSSEENDNFTLTISDALTYAAGFEIRENNFGDDEGLYVYNGDIDPVFFNTEPLAGGDGSTVFLGVISATSIEKLWFDEADSVSTADNMAVANISIAAVPEPASAMMLTFGAGLLFVLRRRYGR